MDQSEYPSLRTALDKLTLNDSSVSVFQDSSVALGQGWRLGFLGLLHMDVFRQRIEEVGAYRGMACVGRGSVILLDIARARVCVCVCVCVSVSVCGGR